MMMRVAAGDAKLWLRRTNVRSSTRKKCGRLAKIIDSLYWKLVDSESREVGGGLSKKAYEALRE